MSTIIDGTAGITFPDASTQSKAVSQVTPFAVTASSIAGAELQLPEATANGVNYVAIKAPNTLAANTTFTLPAADGTNGQVLQTNGTGALAFGNLAAANGGTGLTSPGTAGNLLTSNGTGWTSAAAPASGGSLNAIASGSLSDGSTIIVNADGTVSMVAPVITPVPSAGTPVAFGTGTIANASAAYDTVNQKVVVLFSDTGGAFGWARAVVGTVSGTTITFGATATVSASIVVSATTCVYDPNTQKIIVAFRDDTNTVGAAAVGTVSGTTISFGTVTNFFGGSGIGATLQAVYDALAQRVVIAFIDAGTGAGKVAVGAVSGTSITFGSTPQFSTTANEVSAVYDANAQKVVIALSAAGGAGYAIVGTTSASSMTFGTGTLYSAASVNATSIAYDASALKVVIAYQAPSTSFGTAVVGTVSGTSISFGTPVVFQSSAIDKTSIVYDASVQKVVISYNGTSNFGTAILGTVSGTSISFSTTVVFQSASMSLTSSASAYNTAAQRVVTAFRLTSGSLGRAVVIRSTTSTPNLTSENFIGFSSAAYTNGQTATIQLVGSVNTAQSGLTPGESYFVQTDGTLGLTAGSPSVFAGTAVAANKIIVKG